METIDVSLFPEFKQHTLNLLGELDAVYSSDMGEGEKATQFNAILTKYEMI